MSEQGEAPATLTSNRSQMERRLREMTSAVLTDLRLEGKLCDVVIRVGDAEFDAHKIILCSCSSYFCTLFTGAWATSKTHYTIPGVSPEMMHLIINYAYTNSVPVTEDNVVELLAAADQFLVPGVVQACCFFLENQLCLTNCIGIWRLVDFYYCPEMRHKVFHYILHRFEEVVLVSQELMELSVEQLAAFIENDRLNVRREKIAFEFILRWINHLPDQRRGHISMLLPKVRLGLMSHSYIYDSMANNDVIKDSIKCRIIINRAMNRAKFGADRRSKYVNSSPLNRPRLPSAILLVTGGNDGISPVPTVEAYDARADCWVTVNTDNIRRDHHAAAVLNNFVYLIGGYRHDVYMNTVQKFDLVTCTWHRVAPINFSRCYVSVAVQNGCIYAMGGYNGHIHHNSVECYNPITDQWLMVASMYARRSGASSATLNGKVYICGGFTGGRFLSSAECYDPIANHWTIIARMMSCRNGLGVAAYRGQIYAVGGRGAENMLLSSAEAYNPRTNRWTFVPSMQCPRSHFGIAVVEDQLIVVGGHNSSITMSDVERYDEDDGMWCSAASMEMSRSGLSCSVLHGLYSVAENLFPRFPQTLPDVGEQQEDPSETRLSPHTPSVLP